jgi:predicted metal-binding protein
MRVLVCGPCAGSRVTRIANATEVAEIADTLNWLTTSA